MPHTALPRLFREAVFITRLAWRTTVQVAGPDFRPVKGLRRENLKMTACAPLTILRAPQLPGFIVEINPIKSEITALQERFDALRGYL